jgi:exodeoxyribonuclease VII large subunit
VAEAPVESEARPETEGEGNKTRSVSQVVSAIKRALEGGVGRVEVVGEISSFRAWRSGHWYFDLKDERALLPAVMFRGDVRKVRIEPEDGMEVLVRGRITLYEAQSKAQLVVDHLEPVGQGALALAFEKLKARLAEEGLFDADRKKPLPLLPRTVGLVTSPQGAALADMLRILRQRMPGIGVLLSPTRVQGKGAGEEIAAALRRLDASGKCDVIIVGRGGGSLEDLWAFNEEVTARAIASCETPVISAVGHETDITIADWVADWRVATPSHGAARAVPEKTELLNRIRAHHQRLNKLALGEVHLARLRLERLTQGLGEPRLLLARSLQRLDQLGARLEKSSGNALQRSQRRFSALTERLRSQAPHRQMTQRRMLLGKWSERLAGARPSHRLDRGRADLDGLALRQHAAMDRILAQNRENLAQLTGSLSALSPLAVLARGYGVVTQRGSTGESVITRAAQISPGDAFSVRMEDGKIRATATHVDLGEQKDQTDPDKKA